MKNITLLILSFLTVACGTGSIEKNISNGNFDSAISKSISKLSTNKDAKSKQEYVYLLQDAYAKANKRDLTLSKRLAKEANAVNFEKVYNLYLGLQARQDKINRILPLKLLKEGKNATFATDDYSDEIISSKNGLSGYLYANSMKLLESNNKVDLRLAYDDLKYLDQLNPNYLDVRKKIDEAQFRGTDFVHVYTKNETNMVIPIRLQEDLLNFSTYGLNDKWTLYHNNKQNNITYDFGLLVNFRQINISADQSKEKEFVKEKLIKDGTKTLLNDNGNAVKDSLGNPIQVDNFKTVRVNIYEFRQFKSVQITAKIDYIDYNSKQLIETFPIASEYIFENIYATFNGDKKACETDYYTFFDKRAVSFPSSEQMIFDSGEDLKAKLKSIITQNRFRK
ncbi:hypothetical protein [uncultured Flavobacterium sp.]|uniref:hypothetical protein n=1 Tax=uncultured Flavobacterium sp. TaxID=165435 RepID=UPI0030CA20C0